jgi:hypothetical protein
LLLGEDVSIANAMSLSHSVLYLHLLLWGITRVILGVERDYLYLGSTNGRFLESTLGLIAEGLELDGLMQMGILHGGSRPYLLGKLILKVSDLLVCHIHLLLLFFLAVLALLHGVFDVVGLVDQPDILHHVFVVQEDDVWLGGKGVRKT